MKRKEITILLATASCIALNGLGAILDTTFDPGTGANGEINAIAIESGKILIGGTFTSYNGTAVSYIARLNTNGSLDTSFSGSAAGGVRSIVIQNVSGANKILIGGNFTSLKRMNANGTTDTGFSAPTLNHYVNGIALDSSGNIVFGGEFTTVNGYSRMRVARLSSSGALDGGFLPGYGANNTIYSVSVDNSDEVIVGGVFTILGSYPGNGYPSYPYLGRLNTDGTLDSGFTPAPNNYVYDARYGTISGSYAIMAGGAFTSIAGVSRDRFHLLQSSGTEWSTSCSGANGSVYASAQHSVSGDFYLGGAFTTVNGETHKGIVRLSKNDRCPNAWNDGSGVTGGSVLAIAIQSDDQVLIGGSFTTVEGESRNRIARLND